MYVCTSDKTVALSTFWSKLKEAQSQFIRDFRITAAIARRKYLRLRNLWTRTEHLPLWPFIPPP